MKITKNELKQIIKEEIENITGQYNFVPKVGDVWQFEDNDGNMIYRKVTKVEPPKNSWDEWRISIGDSRLTHVGWWLGQGWSESDSTAPYNIKQNNP